MDFTSQISGPLAKLEEELFLILTSQEPVVQEINKYLLETPGKRIRPALFFLSLALWKEEPEEHLSVAVALELIHSATLVHDDVVDASKVRRGKPSINEAWGNHTAVLTGDYLFARAFELLTEYGNISLIKEMSALVRDMSEGEIQQQAQRFRTDLDIKNYLQRIAKKTARFFMVCAKSGGVVARPQDTEAICALENYGYNVGMAFQLIDDLLDVTGNEDTIGKPLGEDLSQGVITLPILHVLQVSSHGREFSAQIASRQIDDSLLSSLKEEMERHGCAEFVKNYAWQYVKAAQQALEPLPRNSCRETLDTASRFIVERWF
ncbi:polyprenyl synthetase family protein [Dethiobacter alkaliphilus]|uniref:polyprenyl synthetase family protein n=1 Tax=Dethiobacter alkaliphilus TaxID=427926 RepID=UPI002225FB61|nr:polyprenyl synthetase family protein [Dethiobacter alkaliphilus]MCW3491192.1 polyprenyl synthetase family protein [Dethiobacter alkaliphilus]